ERSRRRGQGRIEPPRACAVDDPAVTPAELRAHPVAGLEPVEAGLDDTADRPAVDRRADVVRVDVRADAGHAAAHVRVDRDEDVADEDLALPKRPVGLLAELEVGLARLPLRPRSEHQETAHATGWSGISPSPASSSCASSSDKSS